VKRIKMFGSPDCSALEAKVNLFLERAKAELIDCKIICEPASEDRQPYFWCTLILEVKEK